jgi:type IV pilus biogenesis protein CpaD/CtpE
MGPSLVDQHMGDAIRANVAQQTENPNAAYENTEATHIDPDTAAAVIERYYENQRQPNMQQQAPSAVFQIDSN